MTDEAALAGSLDEFSACVFMKEAEGHIPETWIHFRKGKSKMLKGSHDHTRAASWAIRTIKS